MKELEEKSPGQLLIAENFGKTIPGVKSKELLSAKNYELAINEDA